MQGKEKDDENSELFKEFFDAALHNYVTKSDSSIYSVVPWIKQKNLDRNAREW